MAPVTEEALERATCQRCGTNSRHRLSAEERDAWQERHTRRCTKQDRVWTCPHCGAMGQRMVPHLGLRTMAITLLRGHYRRCKRLPPHLWRRIHKDHDWPCPYTPGEQGCPGYFVGGKEVKAPNDNSEEP